MHFRACCALLLYVAAPLTCLGADAPEYREIRAARPDGRTTAVRNLVLERDVHKFTFSSGTFHFLAPVGGRTIGAIFTGKGRYELTPATAHELRQLRLVTGQKELTQLVDEFDELVLLFSDATAGELEKHAAAVPGSPSPQALAIYEKHLERQKRDMQLNLHLRILTDVLNQPESPRGVFLAALDGKKLAPALVVFDPDGVGNLAAQLSFFGGEESAYLSFDKENGGFWYLNNARSPGSSRSGKVLTQFADALHYAIDTTIRSNLRIEGRTTIRLSPLRDLRVLPLHIHPKLRITAAKVGARDVQVVQEEVALGALARLFRAEVADADAALVFPSKLAKGEEVEVEIAYEGSDILFRLDSYNYAVRERESWYPNLGTFIDTATFDLTYRFPKGDDLISIGKQVRETVTGDQKVSLWSSDRPTRVAGFNYGRFRKLSRHDDTSGVTIDVYTIRERSKFASDAMADAVNTARVGTAFFGPLPFRRLSVTQQAAWSFGQSLPSLIYLPVLALTSSTERVSMFGPAIADLTAFVNSVGPHEVAHQWWGHLIGWATYRDQWLSEGFSDFTAALVIQQTGGFHKYLEFIERNRREVLEKIPGSLVRNSDAGPITQGHRLGTRNSPAAGRAMVYAKGSLVLHMLRMLMRDPSKPNPDENFIAMMKEFVKEFSDQNPSTNDFQHVVERHMRPNMNVTGNGSMRWFFDQWVHGTEIPSFKNELKLADAGGGAYTISGTVSQHGVSDSFVTPVPVYVDFGKDESALVGSVLLKGNTSLPVNARIKLPARPRRVAINLMHDVLARD